MPELIPAIDLRRGRRRPPRRKATTARRTAYEHDPHRPARGDSQRSRSEAGPHRRPRRRLRRRATANPLLKATGPLRRTLPLEVGGGFRNADDISLGPRRPVIDRIVLGSLVAQRHRRASWPWSTIFPGRLVPAIETGGGRGQGRRLDRGGAAGPRRAMQLACTVPTVQQCWSPMSRRTACCSGPNLESDPSTSPEATGIPAILSGGVQGLEDLKTSPRHSERPGGRHRR